MADTSIGISEENWALLNRMKESGESFDDVVKKVMEWDLRKEDIWWLIETPAGVIHFDCYTGSGDYILLKRGLKNKGSGRLEMVGEFDMNTPFIPFSEIVKRVPAITSVPEDSGFGTIKEEDMDIDDLKMRYNLETFATISVKDEDYAVEGVKLNDLETGEDVWVKMGDVVEDDFYQYKLVKIVTEPIEEAVFAFSMHPSSEPISGILEDIWTCKYHDDIEDCVISKDNEPYRSENAEEPIEDIEDREETRECSKCGKTEDNWKIYECPGCGKLFCELGYMTHIEWCEPYQEEYGSQ